jgi:Flp pilus assembly protein TadD
MPRRELLAGAGLAVIVAVVYAPVRGFPFISYDDPFYVTENPHLASGLTAGSVRWTRWNDYSDNWFPLTWLSHLLDRTLFGLEPGPQHVVNALLHVANAVLLFAFLRYATGSMWRSWVAAALFALHPLRVESVAWVSERKDVLSGLFFLLTLLAYAWYARRRSIGRYIVVVFAYAAALMSKPMVVTVPFLLLLLDVWPLRATWTRRTTIILEKLPLLAMAIALCVATVIVQRQVSAVKSGDRYTLAQRSGNAVVSYVRYVQKTVWPRGLAVFYPHPGTWPAWQIAGCALLLAGATYTAWRVRKDAPYALVGWLWFLGMLVPVIGIVQVGDQSMADRYTYLPSIGLMIAIVWGVTDFLRIDRTDERLGPAIATAAILVVLAIATSLQLRHWAGGTTPLFQHAVNVTDDNWLAHRHLASALADDKRYDEAATSYRIALRLSPTSAQTHYNYGNFLAKQRRYAEAVDAYREAVRLDPRFALAHNSLGAALASTGDADGAQAAFREAIRLDARYADPHANLGVLLAKQDRRDEAIAEFHAALRLKPGHLVAQRGLAALEATPATREATR